jgi:elongation factor Ts
MSDTVIVQKLRDLTGAGVMECKKALVEAGGDIEKAATIIREKGVMKMEKRSDRDTSAGLVLSYVHNNRVGALLDIRSETDFVVRSEPFQALAHDIVMHIAAMAPERVEDLLVQPFVKDPTKTVEALITETSAKVGENIRVKNFYRMEI